MMNKVRLETIKHDLRAFYVEQGEIMIATTHALNDCISVLSALASNDVPLATTCMQRAVRDVDSVSRRVMAISEKWYPDSMSRHQVKMMTDITESMTKIRRIYEEVVLDLNDEVERSINLER